LDMLSWPCSNSIFQTRCPCTNNLPLTQEKLPAPG
jgi:hypothetical protein